MFLSGPLSNYKINKTKVLDVTKDVTNNVTNTEDEKIENKIADDNFSKTFGESDSTIESSKNTSTAINISGEHSDDNVKEPFLRENDVPNNTSASQENEIKYLIYSVEEKDSVLNLKSENMKMTKEVRNLIIGIVESNEVFYKCKRCSKKFSTKSDISTPSLASVKSKCFTKPSVISLIFFAPSYAFTLIPFSTK